MQISKQKHAPPGHYCPNCHLVHGSMYELAANRAQQINDERDEISDPDTGAENEHTSVAPASIAQAPALNHSPFPHITTASSSSLSQTLNPHRSAPSTSFDQVNHANVHHPALPRTSNLPQTIAHQATSSSKSPHTGRAHPATSSLRSVGGPSAQNTGQSTSTAQPTASTSHALVRSAISISQNTLPGASHLNVPLTHPRTRTLATDESGQLSNRIDAVTISYSLGSLPPQGSRGSASNVTRQDQRDSRTPTVGRAPYVPADLNTAEHPRRSTRADSQSVGHGDSLPRNNLGSSSLTITSSDHVNPSKSGTQFRTGPGRLPDSSHSGSNRSGGSLNFGRTDERSTITRPSSGIGSRVDDLEHPRSSSRVPENHKGQGVDIWCLPPRQDIFPLVSESRRPLQRPRPTQVSTSHTPRPETPPSIFFSPPSPPHHNSQPSSSRHRPNHSPSSWSHPLYTTCPECRVTNDEPLSDNKLHEHTDIFCAVCGEILDKDIFRCCTRKSEDRGVGNSRGKSKERDVDDVEVQGKGKEVDHGEKKKCEENGVRTWMESIPWFEGRTCCDGPKKHDKHRKHENSDSESSSGR